MVKRVFGQLVDEVHDARAALDLGEHAPEHRHELRKLVMQQPENAPVIKDHFSAAGQQLQQLLHPAKAVLGHIGRHKGEGKAPAGYLSLCFLKFCLRGQKPLTELNAEMHPLEIRVQVAQVFFLCDK